MKIIGLCGGSGSGKGTVSVLFLKHGFRTIDTDAVYHKLVSKKSKCLDALTKEFGEEILSPDSSLNRKKLSEIVFKSEESASKLAALNAITHKFVLEETRGLILRYEKMGVPAVLIDAPLLFESGFNKECDEIICVTADKDVRVERIMKRDGLTKKDAFLRVNTQLPDEYLIRNSDYNIENNKTDGVLHTDFFNRLSSSCYIFTWEHFYPANDYHLFVPTASLTKRIDAIAKDFGEHAVGVHIRRTDNTWAIANSKSDEFSVAIRKELEQFPDAKFYIATDDITEEERLRKEFGNAIVSNTSKTLARDSVEGMHDALIDLFCLSRTKKIFGSFYSSFTDIAADMRGIEKIVVGKTVE